MTTQSPIRSNKVLREALPKLKAGDVICTRIRMRPGEEHLLVDLLERGVVIHPAASAQLASRSKAYQVRILGQFMPPGTRVIYDRHQLMQAISDYNRQGIGPLVVKRERKNGGEGIHLFASIEDVFNLAGQGVFAFPFVIQPFVQEARDLRVIILGSYVEAYQRNNPHNFRHNLHCGGSFTPSQLSETQLSFCHQVMARGKFPYAHLDLMFSGDNQLYLMEINLRGGLRGARIKGEEYLQRIRQLDEEFLTSR